MEFQNPSFKFFLNGRTNKRTDKPKAICSPLFQSWGHNKFHIIHYARQFGVYELEILSVLDSFIS